VGKFHLDTTFRFFAKDTSFSSTPATACFIVRAVYYSRYLKFEPFVATQELPTSIHSILPAEKATGNTREEDQNTVEQNAMVWTACHHDQSLRTIETRISQTYRWRKTISYASNKLVIYHLTEALFEYL